MTIPDNFQLLFTLYPKKFIPEDFYKNERRLQAAILRRKCRIVKDYFYSITYPHGKVIYSGGFKEYHHAKNSAINSILHDAHLYNKYDFDFLYRVPVFTISEYINRWIKDPNYQILDFVIKETYDNYVFTYIAEKSYQFVNFTNLLNVQSKISDYLRAGKYVKIGYLE